MAMGGIINDKLHEMVYLKTSEVGCADGINGQFDGSVDGLPYAQHLKMYQNLCEVYNKNDDDDGDEDDDDEKKNGDDAYLPLPGSCLIKRTFDLKKDLMTLKEKYKGRYKELLQREWRVINKDLYENGGDDVMKIMQFNMLADGLSEAYTSVETEKSFIGVDRVCTLCVVFPLFFFFFCFGVINKLKNGILCMLKNIFV